MSFKLIRDWLTEYKSLSEADTKSYAAKICSYDGLTKQLYTLFRDNLQNEMLEPVCHQLFEFYRSSCIELRRFTLEFVPALICVYLESVSRNQKRNCTSIETTLLGIYNLEVVNKDGSRKTETFNIPTLGRSSIFHEPQCFGTLTESVLSKYDQDQRKVKYGPFPQIDRVNSRNRLSVLSYILRCYNSDIASFSTFSHASLCQLASRVCQNGFHQKIATGSTKAYNKEAVDEPRVTLSSDFLVEVLNGIYFVMFNGQAQAGMLAVNHIHTRACHDLYADVLLVTNAIKNSVTCNPAGQPSDGPIGVCIAVSSGTTSAGFGKAVLTNASFRIKKLPDDISVPDENVGSAEEPIQEKTKPDMMQQITKPLKSVLKMGDKLKSAKKEFNQSSPKKHVVMEVDSSDLSLKSQTKTATDAVEMKRMSFPSEKSNMSDQRDGNHDIIINSKQQIEEMPVTTSVNQNARPLFHPASHHRDIRSVNGDTDRVKINPNCVNTEV